MNVSDTGMLNRKFNLNSASRPVEVVCVGQVPPPYHGQAVMIAALLEGSYRAIRLHHVPLTFSRVMDEVGRFRLSKLIHLPFVVGRIWHIRVRYGAQVLYYPPAGPHIVPIMRDIGILLPTRPLFPATVFHFHAGGLGAFLPHLPAPLRLLARVAYRQPDLAIRNSTAAPDDGAALGARAEAVIPCGINDAIPEGPPLRPPLEGRPARLLFIGALRPSKGVLVLVEAIRQLVRAGYNVSADLAGAPISPGFEARLREVIVASGLSEHVRLRGVLTGPAKDAVYRAADIFCFPTFYEAETLGVVVLEAMQYGLPVVATRWRGVVDLVRPGVNGLLVPPCDPHALAGAVAELLDNPAEMRRMGAAGRAIYLERFTLERYRADIEAALVNAWNMAQKVIR